MREFFLPFFSCAGARGLSGLVAPLARRAQDRRGGADRAQRTGAQDRRGGSLRTQGEE